jgi:hypothetical protein
MVTLTTEPDLHLTLSAAQGAGTARPAARVAAPEAPVAPVEAPPDVPAKQEPPPGEKEKQDEPDIDEQIKRIIREIPDPTPQPGGQ